MNDHWLKHQLVFKPATRLTLIHLLAWYNRQIFTQAINRWNRDLVVYIFLVDYAIFKWIRLVVRQIVFMDDKFKDGDSVLVYWVIDVAKVNWLQFSILVWFVLFFIHFEELGASIISNIVLARTKHNLSKLLKSYVAKVYVVLLEVIELNIHWVWLWFRIAVDIDWIWLQQRVDKEL
jgi:hypothetical protein